MARPNTVMRVTESPRTDVAIVECRLGLEGGASPLALVRGSNKPPSRTGPSVVSA